MSSPLFADHPAPPPERDAMDALITQTRRLRGEVDAVRRDTTADQDDTLWRWQRALCDLAVHQLDDLGAHLGQLRAGRPEGSALPAALLDRSGTTPGALTGRVGSAEWNLTTDEVSWSDELFDILDRPRSHGPLSLDELPSLVFPEDRALLTSLVTGCLIDGTPIDGEFRVVTSDGRVRTVHMLGEPVLDAAGCTASMWAVLRDISELRRSERAVRATLDSLRRSDRAERSGRRMAEEFQEAVLTARGGRLRLRQAGPTALDAAALRLPGAESPLLGGDWYDVFELPGGDTLVAVGDLTGHGVSAASSLAMVRGALRGIAVAGIRPGPLLGHLNQLVDTQEQPALSSALCGRYEPGTRMFSWAQAGHSAPLLFRDGTGRALTQPDGVLLGATSGATYEQADVRLLPGDVLVLYTDGVAPDARQRLLSLAPVFTAAAGAEECADAIGREFDADARETGREGCLLVARAAPAH